MTFRTTFQQTDVADCIQPGIRALGANSSTVTNQSHHDFEGSVDIDTCLTSKYPQDHRWDYAFGLGNKIYYVEVHHASDSEVRVVIAKYQWLRDWQNRQPDPTALKTNSSYHWISSGRVSITKNSRYTRKLTIAGLDYPSRKLQV